MTTHALIAAIAAATGWQGTETSELIDGPTFRRQDQAVRSRLGSLQTRLHYQDGKLRRELDHVVKIVTITDLAARTMTSIQPANKTYLVGSSNLDLPYCAGKDAAACFAERGWKKVGEEDANGQACIVYERGGDKLWWPKSAGNSLAWVRRIQTSGNGDVTRTNVQGFKVGPQDPALFVPPPGYTEPKPAPEWLEHKPRASVGWNEIAHSGHGTSREEAAAGALGGFAPIYDEFINGVKLTSPNFDVRLGEVRVTGNVWTPRAGLSATVSLARGQQSFEMQTTSGATARTSRAVPRGLTFDDLVAALAAKKIALDVYQAGENDWYARVRAERGRTEPEPPQPAWLAGLGGPGAALGANGSRVFRGIGTAASAVPRPDILLTLARMYLRMNLEAFARQLGLPFPVALRQRIESLDAMDRWTAPSGTDFAMIELPFDDVVAALGAPREAAEKAFDGLLRQ